MTRPLWAPPEPYEAWCWVELDESGREGAIASVHPQWGLLLLQGRTREIADTMEAVARAHGRVSGHQVRLVHLSEVPW